MKMGIVVMAIGGGGDSKNGIVMMAMGVGGDEYGDCDNGKGWWR